MLNQNDTALQIAQAITDSVKSSVNCNVGFVREGASVIVYFFPVSHTPIAKYSIEVSLRCGRTTIGLRHAKISPTDWECISGSELPKLIGVIASVMKR